MNTEKLISNLESLGWKKAKCWKPDAILLFKKFPGHKECQCNQNKDKQVEIYLHSTEHLGKTHNSAEIEIHGELTDESWIKIQLYGIQLTEDAKYYEQQAQKGLFIWDFAASQK